MTKIVLESFWSQARGCIGRYPKPGEYYHYPGGSIKRRIVYMVGMRKPLRVGWYIDGQLNSETVLQPWVGVGFRQADLVVECRPEDELPKVIE